jgi:hypothetical protein
MWGGELTVAGLRRRSLLVRVGKEDEEQGQSQPRI